MLLAELAVQMYNGGNHFMHMTTEQVEFMDDHPEVIDKVADALKELFTIAEKAQKERPSGFDNEIP